MESGSFCYHYSPNLVVRLVEFVIDDQVIDRPRLSSKPQKCLVLVPCSRKSPPYLLGINRTAVEQALLERLKARRHDEYGNRIVREGLLEADSSFFFNNIMSKVRSVGLYTTAAQNKQLL